MEMIQQRFRQRLADRITISDHADSLCSLPRLDYSDAFRAATDRVQVPETWARAVLEGPPAPIPACLHFLWAAVVRLDLAPRADRSRVLGWKVAARTERGIVLDADAPGMRVQLVAVVEPTAVSWTTFMYFKNWFGRLTFKLLATTHRALATYLLLRAAS
jgi:hypothetical protein